MRTILIVGILLIGVPCFGDETAPQNSDDATIQELVREQNAQKAAYEGLNQVNLMSQNFSKTITPNTASLQNHPLIQTVQKFISLQKVQALLKYLSSPQFLGHFQTIQKNPNKMNLIYAQIGLFLFFILYRAWKSPSLLTGRWIKIIWIRLWTGLVYFALAGFILPWLFLGDSYYQIGVGLFQILLEN